MNIVAYSYLAALHCPHCTRSALRAYRQQIMRPHPGPEWLDEHGLPDDMIDREGNPVRPVFSTDEIAPSEVCDDCFRPLTTPTE
jgi:hypothetical protein